MSDTEFDPLGRLRRSPEARRRAQRRVERTLRHLDRGSPRERRLADRIRRDVKENGR